MPENKSDKAIENISKLFPKLSDFEKGIVLGTVEQMANQNKEFMGEDKKDAE